jgi:hypothetical protein
LFALALRIALIFGFCIDAGVGLLCLVAQPLLQPLLDLPVKDPAVTTIAGGELVVAAGIYAFVLRDPRRWQPGNRQNARADSVSATPGRDLHRRCAHARAALALRRNEPDVELGFERAVPRQRDR